VRGTADKETLTGRVQRALSDEWQTQGQIVGAADIRSNDNVTIQRLLERLVREGRAESRHTTSPGYLSGGFTEYRRPQA
jgi:hypothetical protein